MGKKRVMTAIARVDCKMLPGRKGPLTNGQPSLGVAYFLQNKTWRCAAGVGVTIRAVLEGVRHGVLTGYPAAQEHGVRHWHTALALMHPPT